MSGPARRPRAALLAAGLAGGLALLAAALLWAGPLLVDREALAQRVATELTTALAVPVEVDAVTGLRLLPRPQAMLGPLRVLAPDADADAAPLAAAERVRLELAWPALLQGRAEPVSLAATGLDIDWGARRTVPPPRWLAALHLPGLRVHGGELLLDYPSGADRLQWPLRAPAEPQGRPSGDGPLRLTADLPLDQPHPRLAGVVRLTAQAHVAGLPAITIGPLHLTATHLDIGALRDVPVTLSAQQAHSDGAGHWRLEGIELRAGELRLSGRADLYGSGPADVTGSGELDLAPLDLRAWLAGLDADPLPGQPSTLRCVAARGNFQLQAGLLTVAPLTLRSDDARAGAAANITLGPLPKAALAVQIDQLDLDPYLTAPWPAAAQPKTAAPCATLRGAAPAPPAPPAPPSDATELHLQLAAARLWVGGLHFGDLRVAADQAGPASTADVVADAFYGGTLQAQLTHRLLSDAPPRQTLRLDVTAADLGALLTDLMGQIQGGPQVTGTADLMAELAATGADLPTIRRDLSGSARADLRDGRLAALDQAAADFGPLLATIGLPVTADALALARLGVGAQGRGGVFDIVDLEGRARLFRLGGAGRVDIADETLDLGLRATLVQPPEGPDLKGLEGIQVPIRVAGAVTAPKVDVQLGTALAEAARRRLQGDGNVLEQLEDATGVQGLERGLRNLFGL